MSIASSRMGFWFSLPGGGTRDFGGGVFVRGEESPLLYSKGSMRTVRRGAHNLYPPFSRESGGEAPDLSEWRFRRREVMAVDERRNPNRSGAPKSGSPPPGQTDMYYVSGPSLIRPDHRVGSVESKCALHPDSTYLLSK